MTAETGIRTVRPRSSEIERGGRRPSSWTYRPSVDIFDTPEALLLIADIPGADADGIDVTLESGVLTIQAEVPPRQYAAARCTSREYGVGGFHRRFEIDESIDTEAIAADDRDGSLVLHLPKRRQARRRRVPVTT